MTSFNALSALSRAFFALWSLLLCLGGIVDVILPLWRKRYLYSAVALVLIVPAYFAWQIIFDISLFCRLGNEVSAVSAALGKIAWGWWIAAFAALTASSILLFGYNMRYEKNHITLDSVKKFLDKLPCGVCCWEDSGRVRFANIRISDLCVAITDGQLLNGNSFYDAVAEKILTVDGKMWRFSCRDITVGKEKLHEMIASDVTGEYAKTQALERDKAELDRLNRELKEYNRNIDDIVRRQEILQAKVEIHDEMNRLMLSTMIAEDEDAEALDRIFSLWEQNALLLCMEANKGEDETALNRVEALAAALKIRLNRHGGVPAELSDERRNLVFSAAQEALANAAKHARAKEMDLSFKRTKTGLSCIFANDGNLPKEKIRFTGGLSNLARLAKEQGAALSVEIGEKFVLSLFFPIENKPNGG